MIRVAVIGSGIAGLTACRALAGRAEVDLYEASDRAGGHAHTVVDPESGEAVDIGFIVWNRERYPRFGAMLDQLGVASRRSNMAFSVCREDGSLELGSASLDALFAQRRNLTRARHYRRIAAMLGFVRRARRDLRTGAARGLTVADYLAASGAPADLAEALIWPLAGALWSMAPDRIGGFPAETLLRFLDQHGMLRPVRPLSWWTVQGGSRTYVDALLASVPARLLLGTPVHQVRREPGGPVVASALGERRYQRVILAVHADTARAMLVDADPAEREVLSGVSFSRNQIWLHRDASFLPRAPAARASWNYLIGSSRDRVSVTYWMNRLMGLRTPRPLLVTLNPHRPIDPALVIHRTRFDHPIFDVPALVAQRRLPAMQGVRGTYFCGAWCGYGFHEDGVRSGLAAAARLLADQALGRTREAAA